jgi:tetraprenyl-beta-curcumene synthase
VVGHIRCRLAVTGAFAEAASRYWLDVFPHVARELRQWRAQAAGIPDPTLRRLALNTHHDERGNLEGAAAFAVLVPRSQRARVVRATVAFQAAYDYVDTLAEQPCGDPLANGRQLHLALLTALDPVADHPDYYAHHPRRSDGGYVRQLIDACRRCFAELPSCASVAAPARAATQRMVAFQSLNHGRREDRHRALARWASALTPAGSGLWWWETAAGAASSLTVFALLAAAATPALAPADARAVERAYFPWIGALHVLLDSLIDRAADIDAGRHCLVDHYSSPQQAAARLQTIAGRALGGTASLPEAAQHALIVAAMTSFYLSAPAASAPSATAASTQVLGAMGLLAAPTMSVLRARRLASSLLPSVPRPCAIGCRPSSPVTRNSSIGLSTCRSQTTPT